jgi:hypothetical protein
MQYCLVGRNLKIRLSAYYKEEVEMGLRSSPLTKSEGRVVLRVDGLRLKEITMVRFKHEEICRGHACPCEVFSLVLLLILLKASLKLYCRNESLFSLFALPLDILAMCTFISLNVLETTLAVPYGIELRS